MKRLRSLHYLRGVSALMVLYAHIVIVGMTDPTSPKLYWPMIPGNALPMAGFPAAEAFLQPAYFFGRSGVSPGHVGVALFFLISGYVILGSLQNLSPRQYVIGRFFRIWPLAAVVTLASGTLFSFYISSKGYESPYHLIEVVKSALLIPAANPPIPVIWSLIVEVWFYAVIGAAFYTTGGRLGFAGITAISGICTAIVAGSAHIHALFPNNPSNHNYIFQIYLFFAYHFTFISFILVGSIIYVAYSTGRIMAGIFYALVGLGLFSANCALFVSGFSAGYLGFESHNATVALALFGVILAAERFMPRSRVLKFFADISYPLYLVHIPIAWIVLHYFHVKGFSGQTAIIAAALVTIGLAYFLHCVIERPTHEVGRKLSAQT